MKQDVLVAVDRKQGGRETLERLGYRLHSMTDIGHILRAGTEQGAITEDQFREIEVYLSDPKKWNEDHDYEWPKD